MGMNERTTRVAFGVLLCVGYAACAVASAADGPQRNRGGRAPGGFHALASRVQRACGAAANELGWCAMEFLCYTVESGQQALGPIGRRSVEASLADGSIHRSADGQTGAWIDEDGRDARLRAEMRDRVRMALTPPVGLGDGYGRDFDRKAAAHFDDFERRFPDADPALRMEALYWAADGWARMGNKTEAYRRFKRLVREYYGTKWAWHAQRRLRAPWFRDVRE